MRQLKHFASKIFSKLVIYGIIILLQFTWLIYLIYSASARSSIFNILLHTLAIVNALYIVSKDMKPLNKISWIFLILCLPIFGCPSYFLFGRADWTKKNRERMTNVLKRYEPIRSSDEATNRALLEIDEIGYKQSVYIRNNAKYPLYHNSDAKYYPNGESVIHDMIKDIESAKHFIFLEYFIIEKGFFLNSILDALEKKVSEGVEVRFIYDDLGCVNTVPPKYYKKLQERGISCIRFNKFHPALAIVMNNRDHRKVLIVDGEVAYTGGINLADEYINKKVRFGYWKDSAIRFCGESVWSFTTMFLEMWDYSTGEQTEYENYRAINSFDSIDCAEDGFIQPFGDFPLDKEDVSENIYLNMINHAKKYVYIFTPYLIIGSEMVRALSNAAKSGVDVRIVTPGIPDKKLTYMITRSNYKLLLQSGVKIYEYTPGFLHAKSFVCDDKYAVVGTVNLDFRSLYMHFECGALLLHSNMIFDLKNDVLDVFEKSHLISKEEYDKRNFVIKLFSSLLNLLAPVF